MTLCAESATLTADKKAGIKDQGLRKKERTEVGRRKKDERPMHSVVYHPSEVYPPLEGGPPSSIGLYQTNITHRTNPTNITILLSANPILLLSQKGIQCFNDDAGNGCVVL